MNVPVFLSYVSDSPAGSPVKRILSTDQCFRTKLRIDNLIRENIKEYSGRSKDAMTERIRELDKKWDMKRTLGINMATLAFTGLGLSVFLNKRWAALSGVVLGFFIQHALRDGVLPCPCSGR